MIYKWVGAILIVCGCGGFGFTLSARYRSKENLLFQMIRIMDIMENELQYRLTPLPELCSMVSADSGGVLKEVFKLLEIEIRSRKKADVPSCMNHVIFTVNIPHYEIREILSHLGNSLGKYDLNGQIRGLEYVKSMCIRKAAEYHDSKGQKVRCYQTLGLCSGIALAILLI